MENQKFMKWFTVDNIIGSIICILIGCLFIFLPDSFSNILVVVSGVLLILAGVVAVVVSFTLSSKYAGYVIAPGVILLILGIYCMTHIGMIKGVLNAFFGVVIISVGAAFLSKALINLRQHLGSWIIPLILSVLTITLGCIVLFGHFDAIFIFTGIVLVIVGMFSIVTTLIFAAQAKKIQRNSNDPLNTEWHEVK